VCYTQGLWTTNYVLWGTRAALVQTLGIDLGTSTKSGFSMWA